MSNAVIYIDANTGDVGKMSIEGNGIRLLENSSVVSLGNSTSDFLITGGYAFVKERIEEEDKEGDNAEFNIHTY